MDATKNAGFVKCKTTYSVKWRTKSQGLENTGKCSSRSV